MIMDAAEHVPFYRRHWQQAGVDLTRIYSSVPLEFLPVVTRAHLLDAAPEDLIDRRYGGSAVDKRTLDRRRKRFWNALREVGYVPGERVMIISDDALMPTGASLLRWTRVDPSLDDETILATYLRVRPSVLHGPLGLLTRLATRLAASNEPASQPRLVVSTAEQLTDAKRVLLESTFGAKVADFYSTPEQGLVAYSKPGVPGYRSFNDEFVIESLHALPGKGAGRLIVTDLVPGAMPLIRFDTGDWVTRDFAARGTTFAPVPIASFSQREPVRLDRKTRPIAVPERDRTVSGLDAGSLPGALSA
jgi:phenylacetate-coenzyme A ligase PaaK-like adenylate-forming protein